MDLLILPVAVLSAFCFALALVLTRYGLRDVAPLTGAAISVPSTAAMFVLLAPLTVDTGAADRDAALLFAGVGAVFPVAVTVLTFAANSRIGADLTGALGNLSPVFAVALAVVLLDEAPTAGQAAGIAAVGAGIVLMLGGRGGAGRRFAPWALGLPLLAALVRGTIQPVVKLGLQDWPDPFAAITIGYAVSAAIVLALARLRGLRPLAAPRAGRFWFVGVGICNGLAVLTLYTALGMGPVTLVAPLVACYPLFTIALNRLLHRDRSLSSRAGLGIAVTVGGIALLLAMGQS